MRIDDLRRRLTGAFERLDLEPGDADALAGLLVDSELRGHGDHGVAALGLLTKLYRDGELNPRPDVRVLRETDGALVLDGDRGCGPAAPERAMLWCIEHARGRGMASAAVRDWQIIVAAPWVRMAAEAGMIGFACTNFIPLVAPPGGRTPVLGTNPFAYGLPADPPVVLDVATTVIAMQKVRVAAAEGESLPEGLIFDGAGLPTTDPNEFASLAPLGEPVRAAQGLRAGALRRGADRRADRRRARQLLLGARCRGVRGLLPRADGRADRPDQAGRRGGRASRRARRAPSPRAHRARRGAAVAGELGAPASRLAERGRSYGRVPVSPAASAAGLYTR